MAFSTNLDVGDSETQNVSESKAARFRIAYLEICEKIAVFNLLLFIGFHFRSRSFRFPFIRFHFRSIFFAMHQKLHFFHKSRGRRFGNDRPLIQKHFTFPNRLNRDLWKKQYMKTYIFSQISM